MASTFISLPMTNVTGGPIDTVLTGVNEYEYDEVNDVAIGATATILSKIFTSEYKLRRVIVSGTNVATYTLKFNSNIVDKRRSTFADFNCTFDYETGITIPAGTTVDIEVENASTTASGNFSTTILYSEE